MNLKRLRNPLVAAVGALLIGGVSVAIATGPSTRPNAPATTGDDQAGAPDTDTLKAGDQTTPDSQAEQAAEKAAAATEQAGGEVDGPGGHADDPNDPTTDHQFEGEE
ncbi:MAG: hypothetical protein M3R49_05110 [Chloroflexota bacterium]|nr:hypothetical protein [Chloroflexota bacterium]